MYWLTIFFLLPGIGWVSGDDIDGWGSIPYETAAACETAKEFVESYPRDPRAYEVRVECNGRDE